MATAKAVAWTFLTLPEEASAKLPSRGMTSVEGTFNGLAFRATLEPDGRGGHWLKVDRKLREAAGVEPGEDVSLEIAPVAEEPEPRVPADLRKSLAAATKSAGGLVGHHACRRRDWIQWIESAKREATRLKRIESACDMLAKGKRRPCCFDRSGMYAKSFSCPVADDRSSDTRRGYRRLPPSARCSACTPATVPRRWRDHRGRSPTKVLRLTRIGDMV